MAHPPISVACRTIARRSRVNGNGASILRRITYLASRARWHWAVLAAMLVIAAAPKMGWAQPVFVGNVTHCSDSCCWDFKITLGYAVDSGDFMHIDLDPGTTSDACLDTNCWNSQSISGLYHMGHNLNGGPDEWDIIFDNPIAAGISFHVYICGSSDCLNNFNQYNWYGQFATLSLGESNIPIHSCGGTYSGCNGCTYIWGYPTGANDKCYGTVCFQSGTTDALCSVTFHFDPPLTDCEITGLDTLTRQRPFCYHTEAQVDNGFFGLPTNWADSVGPGPGNVTIYSKSPGTCFTNACGGFCFNIPNCDSIPRTVTVISPDTNCGLGFVTPLKMAMSGSSESETVANDQNYPNPLEASTGFRTTIPFTTSAGGIAFIRIVDEKGSTVLRDNEAVTYAGQHFFYFTGVTLPAGTYYYQIEFPKGVVIQNRTMLVVR